MTCSDLKRPCGHFPTEITLANVNEITVANEEDGVVIRWDEVETSGYTCIAVVDLVSGDRVDYQEVPYLSPSASVIVLLPEDGSYGITYWKEDGAGGRSEIGGLIYDYLSDPEALQVLYGEVGVAYSTDLLVHTRQQIYLVQEGSAGGFLLTEKLGETLSG